MKIQFVKGRREEIVATAQATCVPRVGDEVSLNSQKFLLFVRRVCWMEIEGGDLLIRCWLSEHRPAKVK